MIRAGNQRLIREINQNLIIEVIRKQGQMSRAEVAKKLKLSAPSVSSNIDQLLRQGILREIGEGDSIGGRRPILLEFNKDYCYIAGIDLSSEDVRVALGDLQGNILEIKHILLPEEKIGEEILSQIIEYLNAILDKQNIEKESLAVIAVGTPGVIDEASGTLQMAPQFKGWSQINIKEIIEEEFGANVIIKNDMNMAAIGEYHYGAGKGLKNIIYVSVDLGIGAGVILDGKLYEGQRVAAGEIGYWVTDPIKPKVKKEEVGPLESKIAIPAIVQRIRSDVKKGQETYIQSLTDENPDKINFDVFKKAILRGDPYSMKILQEITDYLGLVIANICILLDLDRIIFGGGITSLGDDFLDPLKDKVDRLTPLPVDLVFSQLGNRSGVYGCFAVALEYVFAHIFDIPQMI